MADDAHCWLLTWKLMKRLTGGRLSQLDSNRKKADGDYILITPFATNTLQPKIRDLNPCQSLVAVSPLYASASRLGLLCL